LANSLQIYNLRLYFWHSIGSFELNLFYQKIPCNNENEPSDKPIRSIFIEPGFNPDKPIREQEPNSLSDRKTLDDTVSNTLG